MVRGSVYHGLERIRHIVVPIMNRNCPHIDEDEENQVSNLVQREEKWVDVVRAALEESINRMEGMTGVWCRHFPCMMIFVDSFVEVLAVKTSVNPIDTKVCEEYERHNLEQNSPPSCKKP